jgi:phosphatidylglycerol:prolipoprotein diacylglycerol transferase
MRPFLIDFDWFGHAVAIPSYGVFLALGFSLGYFEALRRAIREGENPRHIENLFLIVVASAVLGSRLFHVFFEDPVYYFRNPAKILAVWEGGYTFYGGMLIGLLGVYLYARIKRIHFLRFADIATPSVLLGLMLGRIGCFLAGCCWGKPTRMPWGVIFSHPDSFAADHVHALHPTQLYESFLAGSLLVWLWARFSKRTYDGQIFFHGLIGYALGRFVIEFFRGDEYRGFVFDGALSYAQLISLVVIPFTLVPLFLFSRMRRQYSSRKVSGTT